MVRDFMIRLETPPKTQEWSLSPLLLRPKGMLGELRATCCWECTLSLGNLSGNVCILVSRLTIKSLTKLSSVLSNNIIYTMNSPGYRFYTMMGVALFMDVQYDCCTSYTL